MKTAAKYRERANFLRKLARDAKLESLRDSYLNMALDWDNMAEAAEEERPCGIAQAHEIG